MANDNCTYFLFLSFALLDEPVTVSVEQFLKVSNLLAQFVSSVGVGHKHAMVGHFNDLCCALDVGSSENGVSSASERFVLHKFEAATMINERVTSDSSFFMVGL